MTNEITFSSEPVSPNHVEAVQSQIAAKKSSVDSATALVQALLAELAALEPPQRQEGETDAAYQARLRKYEQRLRVIESRINTAEKTLARAQAELQKLQNTDLPAAQQKEREALEKAAKQLAKQLKRAQEQLAKRTDQDRFGLQAPGAYETGGPGGTGLPNVAGEPDMPNEPQNLAQVRVTVRAQYGEEALQDFDRLYRQNLDDTINPQLFRHIGPTDQAEVSNHVARNTYYEFQALMGARVRQGSDSEVWGTQPGDPNAAAIGEVSHGQDSPEIEQLQNDLVSMGYMTQEQMNTAPGTFGDMTLAALNLFQADQGLELTTSTNPETLEALENPRPMLNVPINGAAVEHRETLGPATGPAERLPNGAVYQPFENGYVMIDARNRRYVRDLDGNDIAPPVQMHVFNTQAAANEHYLTQWGESPYFQDANPEEYNEKWIPNGAYNCGPASALMALSALGIIDHPSPTEAPDAIRDFRVETGDTAGGIELKNIDNALSEYGAEGIQLENNLIALNEALGRGNPVVIGGYNQWPAWGKAINEADASNYLNTDRGDPDGHFVAVLGMTPEGDYIVGDPLIRDGTILVSREQMQKFYERPFNYGTMEVVPAPPEE